MRRTLSQNLQLKLETLPDRPGVYLMKNRDDRIIYIGKARSLRSRVRSYFQQTHDGRPQLSALIAKVADVEYIVTESDREALILEANQIKAHRPRYNIYLKDDKKYPFIRVTDEPYPRIFSTRDVVKDGSRYLGPFHNARAMRTTLDVMHKIFPVRSCDYSLPSDKVKLCMEHQIRRCEGPCEGLVGKEEYRHTVDQAVRFLKGNNGSVIRELQGQMDKSASHLQYEQAARYRDQLTALGTMQARQKVVFQDAVDRDVIGLARSDDEACCTVMEIREGRLLSQKHHFLNGVIEHSDGDIVSAFTRQFYLNSDFIPRQIHLSVQAPDVGEIADWLCSKTEGRVEILVSQRGIKAKTQEMADINASHQLEERQLKRELQKDRVPQSVFALQRDLGLATPPRRIDGIDISNIQGTDTVGSVVCMLDGKPRRSDYRHFKVKGVDGPDDFASMREVVRRRYRGLAERGDAYPDLLMIDGGKGQLSSAVQALAEVGAGDLFVVGLAKRFEEIFVPGRSESVLLPKTSASLRLLQTLRDEAHRFAINYHRKLRGKRTIASALDRVPGIGPKRRTALLQEFGSVQRLREAEVEQIAGIKGFSAKLAKELKAHLNQAESGTAVEIGDAPYAGEALAEDAAAAGTTVGGSSGWGRSRRRMSDIGQPRAQTHFDTVNDSMTASTDVLTRFGTVRLCWHEETVINVVIGPYDPEERRTTVRRFLPPHAEGQELIAKFLNYFMGREVDFDLPLPPDVGTDFHRLVWTAIKEIPYGKVESYGDIALRLGLPMSRARHVGNAAGQNPMPVIYPCHRLIATTGAITGYSAGIQWKKSLLELEGVEVENDKVRQSKPK